VFVALHLSGAGVERCEGPGCAEQVEAISSKIGILLSTGMFGGSWKVEAETYEEACDKQAPIS